MTASEIIDAMFNHDPYSQWLGIERVKEGPGFCTLKMTVRDEMLNGFQIAHGGISYALADSALAFASNAHGRKCVSVETSISHLLPVHSGDVLTTTVEELSLNHKIGIYTVRVINQHHLEVALFKGSVYRRSEEWSASVR